MQKAKNRTRNATMQARCFMAKSLPESRFQILSHDTNLVRRQLAIANSEQGREGRGEGGNGQDCLESLAVRLTIVPEVRNLENSAAIPSSLVLCYREAGFAVNVPEKCSAWKSQMESGSDGLRNILRNIEREDCLQDGVVSRFFIDLSEQGAPNSVHEAKSAAFNVVERNKDTFLCLRKQADASRFRVLFRLENASGLRYRIPPEELHKRGFRDRDFNADIDEDDLRTITDDYEGPVTLGNRLDLVWVTDLTEIEADLGDLENLSNRLGIEPNKSDRPIVCCYNRNDISQSLHVPSALDGIDQELFEVTTDCDATSGRTKPSAGNTDDGVSESVHRGCSVVPTTWQLR